MLLVLLLLVVVAESRRNAALLVSSSIGYYNFRQASNLLSVYKYLKNSGYQDRSIGLMMPENAGCCQKNPIPGSVSLIDGDYTNLNTQLAIDHRYSTFDLETLFDILRGRSAPSQLNKLRLHLDSQTNLLVYLTGHGGDSYFKLRQRQAIISRQFARSVRELHNKSMYSNYLALSDSCGAATLFEFTNSPRFVSVGSSAEGEKSMSHGHDQRYNSAKSDDFTFYLNELFSEGLADWTVGKLHSYMDFHKLRVHSVLKSNYRGKQGQSLKLTDFFTPKQSQLPTIIELQEIASVADFLNY